jgi:hypothetical protein
MTSIVQFFASDLERMYIEMISMPHAHEALYEDGALFDKCRFCGRDLRDPIHLPSVSIGPLVPATQEGKQL